MSAPDVLGDERRREAAMARAMRLLGYLMAGRHDLANDEVAGLDLDDLRALAASALLLAQQAIAHTGQPMDPEDAQRFWEGIFLDFQLALSPDEDGEHT